MSALVWDSIGERLYETGVSNGVLYREDGSGVAWNGLTSVDQGVDDEVEAVHYDGVKFNDIVTVGDFKGTINSYTYPDEFLEYEGTYEDVEGFFITGQPKKRFGLSYKTYIGDDLVGTLRGYKLHILYNLTAVPSDKTFETMGLDIEPIEFSWDVTGIPEMIDGYRPTMHVIFDSRTIDPFLLSDIEDMLYGTETTEPTLLSLKGLASFVKKWGRFVVTDLGAGEWSAHSEIDGVITMLDADTFEITIDTAVYLDADHYEISSTDAPEV